VEENKMLKIGYQVLLLEEKQYEFKYFDENSNLHQRKKPEKQYHA
jgi:hypothetical protein